MLAPLLQSAGVTDVVVTGLATDYCVKATALDALRLGFATTVLTDAIAAVDLRDGDGEAALEELRNAGAVVTVEPQALTSHRSVRVHLVDATYELFRAHYAPRPPVLGREGVVLSGVSGLVDQLCFLLREQGATHVGCATDRVIESFRNDLYAGYKTSAGMPPELLDQFPVAEAAIEAIGVVLWPMVEFEADDAIAAAADRFAADPRVERILVCTPIRTWRSWCATTGSCSGTAAATSPTTTPGSARSGASPRERPGPPGARRRRGRRLPGLPGWGDKTAAAVLARYGHFEDDPGTRQRLGREGRAEPGRPRADAARPDGGGPPLSRPRPAPHHRRRRAHPAAGRRRARVARRDRARWTAFCDEWGLDRLRSRPHRWLGEGDLDPRRAD